MFNAALKNTNDTFQLERGIAIPKSTWSKEATNPGTLTIRAMQIGQSFFVPKELKASGSLAYQTAKKAGMKIVVRKVAGGLRIWRIK